jgi:hypothetical protein
MTKDYVYAKTGKLVLTNKEWKFLKDDEFDPDTMYVENIEKGKKVKNKTKETIQKLLNKKIITEANLWTIN